MPYLYRHIRLDKNEPFYIGIGSDDDKYSRAYEKSRRNSHWTNIIKNTEYHVEILFEDITWEEACKKEMEFIKLYGRKDLKTGTLCNHTNGGEGLLNPSKEIRDKKRLAMIGKNLGDTNGMKTPEARLKLSKSRINRFKGADSPVSKAVDCFDLTGTYIKTYDSIHQAELETGASNPNISKVCKGLRRSAGNYIWKYKN
jgi:hypothetical protein